LTIFGSSSITSTVSFTRTPTKILTAEHPDLASVGIAQRRPSLCAGPATHYCASASAA
jgi:hypothetical protein